MTSSKRPTKSHGPTAREVLARVYREMEKERKKRRAAGRRRMQRWREKQSEQRGIDAVTWLDHFYMEAAVAAVYGHLAHWRNCEELRRERRLREIGVLVIDERGEK